MKELLTKLKIYLVEKKNSVDRKKVYKETWSIALILVAVFGFRSTFYEPFRIPSGSMIPTLMIGDFIVVDKFAYGFKLPFSDLIGKPVYLTKFKQPERGDIVVFRYPKDPSFNYIKRLIGLPGDEIEIINKTLYVNGEEMKLEAFDGSKIMADMDEKFKVYDFKFYHAITGKHEHVVQNLDYLGPRDNIDKFTVPPKSYFVMGDNRDFSADSRYWNFVPEENIRGEAKFIWFSMIIPFLDDHPFKIRPSRIGTVLK